MIDPIGEWRGDFRIAKLESLLVNMANKLYHEKDVEPIMTTPLDFMMKWGQTEEIEEEVQSQEEMKKQLFAIAGLNAKEKQRRNTDPPPKKKKR